MKSLIFVFSSFLFSIIFISPSYSEYYGTMNDEGKHFGHSKNLLAYLDRNKKANFYESNRKKKLQDKICNKEKNERCFVEKQKACKSQKENELKKSVWKESKKKIAEKEYSLGKYSDLYFQPTWSHMAQKIVNKWIITADVSYNYATDAYDSQGVNRDISKLYFSEQPLKLEDFSFPYKLFRKDIINSTKIGNFKDNTFVKLKLEKDKFKEVVLLGRENSVLGSVNLSRYIWHRDVVAGIKVPFGYEKHRLTFDYDGEITTGNKSLEKITEILKSELKFKGINEFAGSTTGLGDVETFIRVNFKSPYVESFYGGINIVIPTAKKASNSSLWPAEIGNGGHTQGSLFFSALIPYKKCFNPHVFASLTGSLATNVNKRVPRLVREKTDEIFFHYNDMIDTTKVTKIDDQTFDKQIIASPTLKFFDSEIKNIAHYVASFRLRKGNKFNVRVGNIFERFIFRRSFLDVFYDFSASLRDNVYGLSREDWKLDVYEKNTQKVGHTFGLTFDHQLDESSRVKIGVDYIFSGKNVPKLFTARLQCCYSF